MDRLIENAEWMIRAGEWPDRIAQRCGYKSAYSLLQRLHEYGRSDLAAEMRRLDRSSLAYHKSIPTPMDDVLKLPWALRERQRARA
jgi:hypothetical protein